MRLQNVAWGKATEFGQMTSFEELKLSGATLKALKGMGFEEATPIQERAIPPAIQGRDIIGQAQTGTGKTATFGIPMVETLDQGPGDVQGIVVTPTRELAVQVAEELNRIGEFRGVHALPIYGGQDMRRQIAGLKRSPRIIVGTPGRLVDHLVRRKTISLRNVKTVVLDEADEMLDMGFIDDIGAILERTPEGRQTLLFSATMPAQIRDLAKRFMRDPLAIGIRSKSMTLVATEQSYCEVSEGEKLDALCRLLDAQLPALAIVFVRTRRRVDEIVRALDRRGYSADGIHGDLDQPKRDRVLRGFREGKTEVLVATDVAARGLDIGGVTHVYNLDIPQDADRYVHRIGRTGRAGKKGVAITFVTPREMGLMRLIERAIRHTVSRKPVPTAAEAFDGKQRALVESLLGAAGGAGAAKYQGIARDLLDRNDSVTLLSAALFLLSGEGKGQDAPAELAEDEPPRPGPKKGPKRRDHEDSGRRDYEFRKRRPGKPRR